MTALAAAAKKQGLQPDARTPIQYGRSGQMVTAMYTHQCVSGRYRALKVQLNFVEPLLFQPAEQKARSLLDGDQPTRLLLLDEPLTTAYASPVNVLAYDARELVAEKGRAILTRQAAKARDVLDLYILETQRGVKLADHLGNVEKKTRFSMGAAVRYREHFDLRKDRLRALIEEDVRGLLLRPLDLVAFEAYRANAVRVLEGLANDLARAPRIPAPGMADSENKS